MNFIARSAVMHRLICFCALVILHLAPPARAATPIALEHTVPAAVRSFALTAAANNAARASPEFTMVLALAVDATRTVNLRFDRAYLLDSKRPAFGFAATGAVDDDPRATVVWVESAGAVSAVVQLHDKQLQLLPQRGTTNYAWVEINQHQFKDHPADWHASVEANQPLVTEAYKANAEAFKLPVTPPAALVPQAEGDTIIDVMVAYTPAAKAAAGGTAAMDAQINLGVAQTNLAYTNSGVRQQLRLVLAHEIAYDESGNLSTDLVVLRNFGDGALDDLHLLRDAYGADIVSLWVENGGGSCGIASVMSTVASTFARSAFNVVTRSCAVGNYSFAHELGHNMGLRHDPFVDTSVSPYPYGHGYVDTTNKFRTIMAYNDACAAINITCMRVPQFSSATVPYRDWPSGNAGVSNAALALNNTRSTTSVFRNSASANVGGSIQFYPQLVGVSEGGLVTLKVSRLGGSAGAASVRYQTVEQTARTELDFLTLSGQLTWADGELGDKFIRVQTIQDAQNEGTETFKVELFDFVNAVPLVGSAIAGSTATVEIFDDEPDSFPINCTLPEEGWSQPEGATTTWSVARDASTEGACSLKSNTLANTGVAAKAQIQFDGVLTGGTIRFDRRVSSEPAFDCFRFFIDGVVVGLSGTCTEVGGAGVSGNSGWARIEVPITAGNHTLLWSYEKDANTAMGADAAWIDNLTMPLQTRTAPFSVQVSAAGNDVAANVGGTVIGRALNITCNTNLSAKCSADAVLGRAVKLVAMPNATSVVAGWSLNGVQVCTATQNPLAAFNGASCTVDASALNGRTDVLVQFAPRPPRSATIAVLTASKSPSAISEAFSLQVSLAGTGPAGAVDVRRISAAGVQVICPKVPVLFGRAACDVPLNARPVGFNIYQVYYAGDAANKEVFTTIRHAVGTAPSSITLSMEPRTPLRGQTVLLTAQVLVTADDTPPTATSNGKQVAATGAVSFVDGSGNIICEANALVPISPGATIAVTSCSFAPQSSATVAQSVTARYPQGPVSVKTASATINYATVAKIAPDYSDMWWAGEPQRGWGMSIAQHGNTQFNVLYIYDHAGQPVWLVMPGGTWNTEQTEYSGVVYQPQSSPYYAYKTTPDPNTVLPLNVGKPVGQVKLKFVSLKTATLSYTINDVTGTKNIERQVFGAPSNAPRLSVNDLWWGGTAENGWGLNLAQQGSTLFGVWYTYNAQGEATWLVMPGGTWEGNAYVGVLYRTQATAWLGDAYNANFLRVNPAGSLRVEFYDANLGVMNVQLGGEGFAQGRVLVRQGF